MTLEEMQKQIESMMPTPQQILERVDKELEEKRVRIDRDIFTREKLIDKACEWLKNAQQFIVETQDISYFDYKRAAENLRRYLEQVES